MGDILVVGQRISDIVSREETEVKIFLIDNFFSEIRFRVRNIGAGNFLDLDTWRKKIGRSLSELAECWFSGSGARIAHPD